MLDFDRKQVDFSKKKLYLLDMDGTIYQEDRLFDGTLNFLDSIKKNNARYVFITNNSSKSVNDYIEKVKKMGINATYDEFFTSTQATILYLKNNYPNELVYCQGTKSFVKELEDGGIKVTEEVDKNAGVILVGFDLELTSQKLRNTCEMLLNDIPFIAANPDLVCPVSFGFVPDCGSICQMLKNATGKSPIFIGKPEPTMIEIVMKKFNVTKEDTVVIGDRLYTDIASGLNAHVDTVCVLSGEASLDDIRKSEYQPTYIFKSIKDIIL